jgi:hypothetical protein
MTSRISARSKRTNRFACRIAATCAFFLTSAGRDGYCNRHTSHVDRRDSTTCVTPPTPSRQLRAIQTNHPDSARPMKVLDRTSAFRPFPSGVGPFGSSPRLARSYTQAPQIPQYGDSSIRRVQLTGVRGLLRISRGHLLQDFAEFFYFLTVAAPVALAEILLSLLIVLVCLVDEAFKRCRDCLRKRRG